MPSERATRLAQEIHARRQLGLARKTVRKRLPRQITPKGLEREYTREMLGLIEALEIELQPLLDELPILLRTAEVGRRIDAGEGKRISELVTAALERIKSRITAPSLDRIAIDMAAKTATAQRIQMGKQVRAALGADPLIADTGLAAAAEAFTAENVALIQNIPEKTLREIEGVVHRGVQQGKLHKDLAAEVQDRFRISRNRAKLIARDQINKYYGKVQEIRQRNMGVEKFIWRTANDERVRPEHSARDGNTYTWANAPEGGPGAPINCRCFAEPVFDFVG